MFKPYRPYIKTAGMDTVYNIIYLGYYFEFKDVVEAKSRITSFKKELPRLKEIYE